MTRELGSKNKRVFTLGAAAIVSLSGLVSVAACRGVLGIEDLDVRNEGGADGGPGGKVDAPAGDTGGPAASGCSSKPTGMECGKCCHEDAVVGAQFRDLQMVGVDAGCLCGSGACSAANECGNSLCAMAMGDVMTCGPCIDGLIRMNTCPALATRCATAGCKGILDCIKACPP